MFAGRLSEEWSPGQRTRANSKCLWLHNGFNYIVKNGTIKYTNINIWRPRGLLLLVIFQMFSNRHTVLLLDFWNRTYNVWEDSVFKVSVFEKKKKETFCLPVKANTLQWNSAECSRAEMYKMTLTWFNCIGFISFLDLSHWPYFSLNVTDRLIGHAVELLSAKVLGGPPFLLFTGSAHAHLNLPSWVSWSWCNSLRDFLSISSKPH